MLLDSPLAIADALADMAMLNFMAELVAGRRRPYNRWTFVELPNSVVAALGKPPLAVCGTIAGAPFRGTAAHGEGVVRVPVDADLRKRAGVKCGDRIEVSLEIDPNPRLPDIPQELQALLDADPELADAWQALAPSCRRAWAQYVADAKRSETRARRASRAPEGIRGRAFPR